MNLIIGAGTRHIEGYKTHDVLPLKGIDYVCEFFDLPKHVKKSSCDEIQMTHFLEHFEPTKTQKVLKTVKGLLKSGGKLYIEVPNLYWHALKIIEDPTDRQIVEYAYGGQKDKWDYHYTGFTPEMLHEELSIAGFIVDMLTPNTSIECWAVKP